MGQRFQRARYVYINPERLTTEPAVDEVASRPGIGRNWNKAILTHDCSFHEKAGMSQACFCSFVCSSFL
jgi:hypothetical protein